MFGGYAGHLWCVQTPARRAFRRANNDPSHMRRPECA